jgi:uncharacterized protein (DUF362 family)
MPSLRRSLDRRRFMALVAGWSAAGCGGLHGACDPPEGKEIGLSQKDAPLPLVVRLERPSIMEAGNRLNEETASELIEALLSPMAGGQGSEAFLRTLFEPGERVGIKLNCLAGKGLSPRPALVFALIERLQEIGIEPSDIIVFERTERELKRAGFPIRKSKSEGARIVGNDSRGAGFEDEPTLFKSIGSCFSRILTRGIDGLINFGVLKDHDLAGVSIGMKNLYGLIHNPNKYHDNQCSPYVAHVAASPPVKEKLRLTLCDGMISQYRGGPALKKDCTWKAGILLASTDPVALDAVGAGIIEAKRRDLEVPTLADTGRFPAFLEEAHRLGLGEHRLDRIRVVKVD